METANNPLYRFCSSIMSEEPVPSNILLLIKCLKNASHQVIVDYCLCRITTSTTFSLWLLDPDSFPPEKNITAVTLLKDKENELLEARDKFISARSSRLPNNPLTQLKDWDLNVFKRWTEVDSNRHPKGILLKSSTN